MANRPIAPHLQIWKWGPHMAVSILHRITGDGMAFVGLGVLLWWLGAMAGGADSYATFQTAMGSPLGLVVLVGLSMDLVDKQAKVFFMGVDGVKFRRKVVPGDVLELHVKALRGGGRVWKFEGKAYVEGELACEATFMAMFDVPKA